MFTASGATGVVYCAATTFRYVYRAATVPLLSVRVPCCHYLSVLYRAATVFQYCNVLPPQTPTPTHARTWGHTHLLIWYTPPAGAWLPRAPQTPCYLLPPSYHSPGVQPAHPPATGRLPHAIDQRQPAQKLRGWAPAIAFELKEMEGGHGKGGGRDREGGESRSKQGVAGHEAGQRTGVARHDLKDEGGEPGST